MLTRMALASTLSAVAVELASDRVACPRRPSPGTPRAGGPGAPVALYYDMREDRLSFRGAGPPAALVCVPAGAYLDAAADRLVLRDGRVSTATRLLLEACDAGSPPTAQTS